MFKQSELKRLEDLYAESGNQLVVLYGPMNCEKVALIGSFIGDKKYFYYRARQASDVEQRRMMGEEVARKYDIKLQKYTYEEYFNRVKSGDPTKLVVVIDVNELGDLENAPEEFLEFFSENYLDILERDKAKRKSLLKEK